MTRRMRFALFIPSALGLLAMLGLAMHGITPIGKFTGQYGEIVNHQTVYERHTTNAVTAVNFDIRGIDTLGEETIFFMAVMGVGMLLREKKKEEKSEEQKKADEWRGEFEPHEIREESEAVKTVTLGLVGPLVAFGLYIVLHGQVTPGGGFQGGVILATAPLCVYIAGDVETFHKITSHMLVEFSEAMGIAGFIGTGVLGLVMTGEFLRNVLPLGTTGNVLSSGTIWLANLCSGIAIGSGFVSATFSLLEQTLSSRMGGGE